MKRGLLFLLITVLCLGVSWAAFQNTLPEEPGFSRYFPPGALLYVQAKDFSSLLTEWNDSPQKQKWVKSANYQVFSNSRLLLRLKEASDQFTAAAGLPPDDAFLKQVAGRQSALGIYDIGKLQLLYVTQLSSASSMETALWRTRGKFETRNAGGTAFFVRRDEESEREVAFAVSGDHLLLATREDLLAGALQLMAGSKDRTLEAEQWWAQAVSAAGPVGDLRMVMNLEKIVATPYFRSYWIQRNVTDMKQYSAAVSDLFRSRKEYREERVLLKKAAPSPGAVESDGSVGVADLARFVPAQAGFYEVKSDPGAGDCFALLETKILAPHLGPPAEEKLAPQVALSSGETGSGSDLETRIDQAIASQSVSNDSGASLKALLQNNRVRALLLAQATERDKDGVFVRFHSAFALLGEADWNEAEVRSSLVDFVRPGLTAGQSGVEWQPQSGSQTLDGLWGLFTAIRGKYLFISDQSSLLNGLLANLNQKAALQPALFAAGFDHARERENFGRFTGLLDRSGSEAGGTNAPQFFSGNIQSLSSTLAGVASEKILVRDAGDKVLQTVTYEWIR
ncbi:MAG TPA: hypothetical protein VE263_14360 [Candidatus Angelobacter sp.]|nr:hypothetical protein [Candidatus Angelobacter sp.]